MATVSSFSLRPLERNTPDTALEGAFRVHISAKEFKAMGLASGDPIRISTAQGSRGFAVAWLASQTNAANKPIAKVTDLLREKYDLPLKEPVFIEKVHVSGRPIGDIDVSYTGAGYASAEEFLHWACYALVDLDIIVPGCTFDVQQKGPKFRQKGPKIRVTIESIQPPPSSEYPLYFDPIKTRISISDSSPLKAPPSSSSAEAPRFHCDGIGGLSDQIAIINKHLNLLTGPNIAFQDQYLFGPTAFLIHGPEGTGKSLLLERLSESTWEEIFRIDLDWLSSKTKPQSKAMTELFERARNSQPSLILMDDLDKFLGKAEALMNCLRAELKRLEGSKVVVAAAARSIYDIDATLRTTTAFKVELEVFPPNVKQREEILREILGPDRKVMNVDFASLAERMHGFVGRDIHKLCGLARNQRIQAIYESLKAEDQTTLGDLLESSDFVTQDDFMSMIDQVQPTVLKDSVLEVPKVSWTDIAGLEHVRQLLEAITIRPYKFPDLETKFGGPQARKGVLLYGPPGCAKTLIAQAVATESNQNFLAVKGSELIKMYVGESERAIRDVFRRARAAKPCIIFFDEIDSIGKSREKAQDNGLNVVTTLLNEMDGIEALKDVFIIGATNRPDILDSALIRTGRFDAHIHIGLPNEEARRQILEIHTRKRPLAGDVDLNVLASKTEGSSGADIKGLCSVAVEIAISDYEKNPKSQAEIRMCHFEQALDQHVPHTVKEEAERYKGWRPGKSLSAD